MDSIRGSTQITESINKLVEIYRKSLEKPLSLLRAQKAVASARQDILSTLFTKVNTLRSAARELKLTVAGLNQFYAKSATSSNTAKVTASAKNEAACGVYEITVSQLAKNSTQMSDTFSNTGTDIWQRLDLDSDTVYGEDPDDVGDYVFQVLVEGTTGSNITVNVAANDTNETILSKMADAINTTDNRVYATVIKPTSDTARLVVTSKETGSNYTVTLQDVTGNLIGSDLWGTTGLHRTTQKTATQGGYVYAEEELNAIFTLNTEQIERQKNTISDAVTGVTFNLLDTTSTPVTITIGYDIDSIKSSIQEFLDAYNDVINYLNARATVKEVSPGVFERGPLAGHPIFRDLSRKLRSIMREKVEGVSDTNYEILYSIGINADENGRYSITDETKLKEAIAGGISNVAELFQLVVGSDPRGKAAKIYKKLEDYVTPNESTKGYIKDSQNAETDRIEYLEARIASMQRRIDKRVEGYKKSLGALQKMMAGLQGQYMMLQIFYGGATT